jgi:hypothetical protein
MNHIIQNIPILEYDLLQTFIITIFRKQELLVTIMYGEHPTNKLQFRAVEWFMKQASPSFPQTSLFYDNNLFSSFGGFIPIGNFQEGDEKKGQFRRSACSVIVLSHA